MNIALVSCDNLPGWAVDDQPLIDELSDIKYKTEVSEIATVLAMTAVAVVLQDLQRVS